ncbi:MAG: carbamoyltransferase [Candidatus Diapherotrites archaeon]|uniref:Carbamoyltransferase n=1 Tax=Candidatus Iainarchaeum sp. TaxID=3101447 RepID=A0A2D6M1Q2_9ARCH|nr:carbamoyltransferase [Candidatus Diapherotrites archaeon]|tara:strand:- start:4510 stop:6216 length:1707 start_codon:yes stop_codon:yes gene_type:complete
MREDKYVLGIGVGHNPSACLIKNGVVVSAIEQERLNRNKRSVFFNKEAIDFCLKRENISMNEVKAVAFNYEFNEKILSYLDLLKNYETKKYDLLPQFHLDLLKIRKVLNKNSSKIIGVNHHESHAFQSFCLSGFDEAAALVIDGRGEMESSSGWHFKGKESKRLWFDSSPNSLGYLYLLITSFLGFTYGDEYKVMGLSAYGKSIYKEKFDKLMFIEGNEIKINEKVYSDPLLNQLLFRAFWVKKKIPKKYSGSIIFDTFGEPRNSNEKITNYHKDLAASLQAKFEELAFFLLKKLFESTKCKNLCISGGAALNCVMAGKITENTSFENVFIPPAPNDSGTSMGAAMKIYAEKFNDLPSHDFSVYLGPKFSGNEIACELEEQGMSYEEIDSPERTAAELTAEGNIIGWFQGEMEFGPRALGNRSILADPQREKMKDVINEKIKFRESFRPFAPTVLEEKVADYFEQDMLSPYMSFAVRVKEEKKDKIPAVVHINNLARIHTINKKQNRKYYELISEFEKITGVPLVLNTSLNVKGEPIVCTPKDAINCFRKTEIDYLIMKNFMVSRGSL